MTNLDGAPPPTPAVEHLPTVFRKIKSGEYRVPPFQREFIWDEKQVLELLESVYLGFPIGSTLLWKVDRKVFQAAKEISVGFPVVEEFYPTSFVLDGVQRLSSLNGVFNRSDSFEDKRFDAHFDFDNERFLNGRDVKEDLITIPLNTIFKPKEFLNQQRYLASLKDSDIYLEKSIKLLTVFQEYLLPVVTIYNKDPKEVVSIFQRINSTGVRLGVVDFMRALTWSDDFDLSAELAEMQSYFDQRGFRFDDELLLKSLGLTLGLRPLPDVLLALRKKSAVELQNGVNLLRNNLDTTIRFVADGIGIANIDALPYESQWLLIYQLVNDGIDINKIKYQILKWARITSLTEALQGRPDHALVRMIEDINRDVRSGEAIKEVPNHTIPDDIIFKRFTKGKAVSIAFLSHLFDRGVFNNEPIIDVPYDKFLPLFDRSELSKSFNREFSSARTIGNVVFMPHIAAFKGGSHFDYIVKTLKSDDLNIKKALQAQYINERFVHIVKNEGVEAALYDRAQEIVGGIGNIEMR